MAATIADLAQTSKDPLIAGVAEHFLMYSDPMKYMPYETIGDFNIAMSRVATLPSVAYRAINGSYSEGTAKFEQLEETISGILGHDIDIDRELDGNKTQLVPQKTLQTKATMKSIAYKVNDDLINGDRATNPLEPDGLRERLDNLASRQRVAANSTDSLKIFASQATLMSLLDKVEEAIWNVDEGKVDMIIGDETSIRGLYQAVRRIGANAGTVDVRPFGIGAGEQSVRTWTYGGVTIPLMVAGFTDETEATRVITLTEDPGDAGNDATSLYFIRTGSEYFTGIEKRSLDVRDLGELQASPQNRIRVDWPYGYSGFHERWGSRLYGLRWAAT